MMQLHMSTVVADMTTVMSDTDAGCGNLLLFRHSEIGSLAESCCTVKTSPKTTNTLRNRYTRFNKP